MLKDGIMSKTAFNKPLLEIDQLHMRIGSVKPVRGVSLRIHEGETHAIVGESGCGKSMTALALMGLQPRQAELSVGRWSFADKRVDYDSEAYWRDIRRNDMAMIFQNPMASLNPTTRIGSQIAEVIQVKDGLSKSEALKQAVDLLDLMQIRQAALRAKQYPFELSGGMLQRAMIAMAMARKPKLLIADEPTTALDATVQAEVLQLLKNLQSDTGMSLLIISHDLSVVAQLADRVSVMYAGEIVEQATADALFSKQAPQTQVPRHGDERRKLYRNHPYTQALKDAVPSLQNNSNEPLASIEGQPPDLRGAIAGCAFIERCPSAMKCCEAKPEGFQLARNREQDHTVKCWMQHSDYIAKFGGING